MAFKRKEPYNVSEVKKNLVSLLEYNDLLIFDRGAVSETNSRMEEMLSSSVDKECEHPSIEALDFKKNMIHMIVIKDLLSCYGDFATRSERRLKIAYAVVRAERSLYDQAKLYKHFCSLSSHSLVVLLNCMNSDIIDKKYDGINRKILSPVKETLLKLRKSKKQEHFEPDKYSTRGKRISVIRNFVREMMERAVRPDDICAEDFRDFGLAGLLIHRYGGSPKKALFDIYSSFPSRSGYRKLTEDDRKKIISSYVPSSRNASSAARKLHRSIKTVIGLWREAGFRIRAPGDRRIYSAG